MAEFRALNPLQTSPGGKYFVSRFATEKCVAYQNLIILKRA